MLLRSTSSALAATPPHKKLQPTLHTPPKPGAFLKTGPITTLPTHTSSRRKHLGNTTKLTSLVEENAPLTTQAPNPQETADKPFEWTKWWYAAVLLEDLEPKRPTPVKILGRDLVLWRDVNEQWRCFEDACPHRLAPLSEGRIEPSDGSLMCSYHGWRFQSDGTCTRIPQAKDGGASTGCKNPRSKAQAYPVMVDRGVVWVWPDDSPTAFIDCTMSKPNGPDFDSREVKVYMRDLPYPVDGLLENVVDASHVPYAHHGLQGSRETAPPMTMRTVNQGEDPLVLDFEIERWDRNDTSKKLMASYVKFCAPDLVSYSLPSKVDGLPPSTLNIHGTPTSSTTCRVFTYSIQAGTPSTIVTRFFRMIANATGLTHIVTHKIFDGDSVFINGQSRKLRAAEESGKSWKSEYFLPTSSDVSVVDFRRWLTGKIGGGGPRLPNGDLLLSNSFQALSKEAILDRYDSHTRHCKKCQRSLAVVRALKTIAAALSLGFAACAAFTARWALNGSRMSFVGSVAGAFVFAFVRSKLVFFESLYYFNDYEHWKT